MKFIKFLVVTAIVIGGGLFGAKFYAEKNSGELAGVLDQLNPLVKEGNVYVKTKKADSVNGYGIASYTKGPTSIRMKRSIKTKYQKRHYKRFKNNKKSERIFSVRSDFLLFFCFLKNIDFFNFNISFWFIVGTNFDFGNFIDNIHSFGYLTENSMFFIKRRIAAFFCKHQ